MFSISKVTASRVPITGRPDIGGTSEPDLVYEWGAADMLHQKSFRIFVSMRSLAVFSHSNSLPQPTGKLPSHLISTPRITWQGRPPRRDISLGGPLIVYICGVFPAARIPDSPAKDLIASTHATFLLNG